MLIRLFIFLLSFILLAGAGSKVAQAAIKYESILSVDNVSNKIIGRLIIADNPSEIQLDIMGFSNIELNGAPVKTKAGILSIPASKKATNTIKFEKYLTEEDIVTQNFISVVNISPMVLDDLAVEKSWTIIGLPQDFEAISEAEKVEKIDTKNKSSFKFHMNKPLERINIIASNEFIVQEKILKNVKIYTYFFKSDEALSNEYLNYIEEYIKNYEALLGVPFPYERFSVVEHKHPHGYATPTYAVLGETVLRLPFMLQTSLGHEVLHQWFGCAIMQKDDRNFFEAITAYLSDHLQQEKIDGGKNYRKNIMMSYETFVENTPAYPLEAFRYNASKRDQAVGYGKGAMVFHMIKNIVGEKEFDSELKSFVKKYMFKKASWDDILSSFKGISSQDFADYWLKKSTVPEIRTYNQRLGVSQGEPVLLFELERISGTKNMQIPYTIFYGDNKSEGVLNTVEGLQTYQVPLERAAARFVIDADYDIMRKLSPNESPAVLSKILAADNVTLVSEDDKKCDILKEVIRGIDNEVDAATANFATIINKNVVICGYENPVALTTLGKRKVINHEISEYEIYKNPLAHGRYILVAHNPTAQNARLLSHYGKYSKLSFDGARNTFKETYESDYGIVVFEKELDKATETTSAKTLSFIVAKASRFPVVFVGEKHDSYAQHLNQLEVIKLLHKSGKKVAVGFEMIQKQFQPFLDEFIAGKISEREFLNKVEYYDRWAFDYNLYAPIFRYVRDNKIDAIALNIDGVINKKISSGRYDNLTENDMKELPKELRIINDNYSKTLQTIFEQHAGHGVNMQSFADFFTAQNIWDEVMAESIISYQNKNPDAVVVVIAGSGHVSKNSGIPLRYERMTGKKPYVIMQNEPLDETSADAVIDADEFEGEGTPKIGVTLEDTKDGLKILKVAKDSPAEKGGFKDGDLIIKCSGIEIKTMTDLRYELFLLGFNAKMKCSVKRNNKNEELTVELVHYNPAPPAMHGKMTMEKTPEIVDPVEEEMEGQEQPKEKE